MWKKNLVHGNCFIVVSLQLLKLSFGYLVHLKWTGPVARNEFGKFSVKAGGLNLKIN